MSSNEKEIRANFKLELDKIAHSITVDEFAGGALNTRPDLGTFTKDQIIFTEIKSDKDVLTNLLLQAHDYYNNADVVYLVLDKAHLKKLEPIYKKVAMMAHVYVVIYDDGEFFNYRRGRLYKFALHRIYKNSYDNFNSIRFLWRDEVKQLIQPYKLRSKAPSIYEAVKRIYTSHELIKLSYEIIYNRMINRINSKTKIYECGLINLDLSKEDLEVKQNNYNKYLEDTIKE